MAKEVAKISNDAIQVTETVVEILSKEFLEAEYELAVKNVEVAQNNVLKAVKHVEVAQNNVLKAEAKRDELLSQLKLLT